MKTLVQIVFFLTACAAFPYHANSQSWQSLSFEMHIDDEDRDKEIDYSFDSIAIFYSGAGAPNLMLSCSERRGITVAFGLVDLNFRDVLGQTTGRTRSTTVKLLIDGKRTTGVETVYLPTMNLVEPILQKHGRMVFNSVIRNQDVTLTVPGKGNFTYDMPAIDDAFRWFVRSCPVTRK